MRTMPALHVNVDHIATIREARKTTEPNPIFTALMAEQAGASGITVHLREDRRHIQDRDVELIRRTIQSKMNLEIAATDEMVQIALDIKPDIVTFVPEKREEITTEGGLDCVGSFKNLDKKIKKLKEAGIRVSLFIDPEQEQIEAAEELGSDDIELHTGEYANATQDKDIDYQLERLVNAAEFADNIGLQVNAGHGLTYFNVVPIARIPQIVELNIGHSIISRSVNFGIEEAVREMLQLIQQ
ncbi:MAG: pyridoxine 5-phosphate synthase [bacterium]|jgi:pyridoxine 5-phosphate synthase